MQRFFNYLNRLLNLGFDDCVTYIHTLLHILMDGNQIDMDTRAVWCWQARNVFLRIYQIGTP